MATTIIFGRPEMAKIPSTERIHKINSIEAITWKGRGKIPIAQAITASIRTSHKVIG